MRRIDYPGWRMVWALAVTETVSYGVLYYSFAAFLLPMQHGLGWSSTTLTGAFSSACWSRAPRPSRPEPGWTGTERGP